MTDFHVSVWEGMVLQCPPPKSHIRCYSLFPFSLYNLLTINYSENLIIFLYQWGVCPFSRPSESIFAIDYSKIYHKNKSHCLTPYKTVDLSMNIYVLNQFKPLPILWELLVSIECSFIGNRAKLSCTFCISKRKWERERGWKR